MWPVSVLTHSRSAFGAAARTVTGINAALTFVGAGRPVFASRMHHVKMMASSPFVARYPRCCSAAASCRVCETLSRQHRGAGPGCLVLPRVGRAAGVALRAACGGRTVGRSSRVYRHHAGQREVLSDPEVIYSAMDFPTEALLPDTLGRLVARSLCFRGVFWWHTIGRRMLGKEKTKVRWYRE